MSDDLIDVMRSYNELSDEEQHFAYELIVLKNYNLLSSSYYEKEIVDTYDIYIGQTTFIVLKNGDCIDKGFYNNYYCYKGSILIELNIEFTKKFLPNIKLNDKRYYYLFYGAGGKGKLTTIEPITNFNESEGFYAESINYYYLVPDGIWVWKTNSMSIDIIRSCYSKTNVDWIKHYVQYDSNYSQNHHTLN